MACGEREVAGTCLMYTFTAKILPLQYLQITVPVVTELRVNLNTRHPINGPSRYGVKGQFKHTASK